MWCLVSEEAARGGLKVAEADGEADRAAADGAGGQEEAEADMAAAAVAGMAAPSHRRELGGSKG